MKPTPETPLCQSCGRPLSTPRERGTDPHGRLVDDYCAFCFREGLFTEPDLSFGERADPLTERSGVAQATAPRSKSPARKVLPILGR